MKRYDVIKVLGDGAYGVVSKAQNRLTGEVVAIKKLKQLFRDWEACIQLREVKSLKKLSHPNIIKLKEVIRESDELFFVFEYANGGSVFDVIKAASGNADRSIPEPRIRSILWQVFQGLAHMHKHGFFHRDLKPENLLMTSEDAVKIADFGLAREVRSRPPYTEYVSTRWYRAPEVVLHSTAYNSPIDMWAMGAIMAELYTLRPLFPGQNESDQMFRFCSVLGTPTAAVWPDGMRLASAIGAKLPQVAPTPLTDLIRGASEDAIDLISKLLRFDPNRRLTASQALQHPYFTVVPTIALPSLREHHGSSSSSHKQQHQQTGFAPVPVLGGTSADLLTKIREQRRESLPPTASSVLTTSRLQQTLQHAQQTLQYGSKPAAPAAAAFSSSPPPQQQQQQQQPVVVPTRKPVLPLFSVSPGAGPASPTLSARQQAASALSRSPASTMSAAAAPRPSAFAGAASSILDIYTPTSKAAAAAMVPSQQRTVQGSASIIGQQQHFTLHSGSSSPAGAPSLRLPY